MRSTDTGTDRPLEARVLDMITEGLKKEAPYLREVVRNQAATVAVRHAFEIINEEKARLRTHPPPTLMSLPPELRLRIYEHCVVQHERNTHTKRREQADVEVFTVDHPLSRICVILTRSAIQPAITRTCRLLRDEALPLFYSLNNFVVVHDSKNANDRDSDRDLAVDWLRSLEMESVRQIRSISYRDQSLEPKDVKSVVRFMKWAARLNLGEEKMDHFRDLAEGLPDEPEPVWRTMSPPARRVRRRYRYPVVEEDYTGIAEMFA